jgi:hypothetical protein
MIMNPVALNESFYESEIKAFLKSNSVDSELVHSILEECNVSNLRQEPTDFDIKDSNQILQIKETFLIKKLRLKEGIYLDEGIDSVIKKYGNRIKYKPMFYYLLVEHFNAKAELIENNDEEYPLEVLSSFGEKFISSQTDIDADIRKATDEKFTELLL